MTQDLSYKERRRHPRNPYSVEISYTCGTGTITENTVNLNQGGTFIKTDNPLMKDSVVKLEFDIPNISHHFKMNGRVAWVQDRENEKRTAGMGVEFLDITKEDLKNLHQFIVTSQLTQRR